MNPEQPMPITKKKKTDEEKVAADKLYKVLRAAPEESVAEAIIRWLKERPQAVPEEVMVRTRNERHGLPLLLVRV